MPEPRGARSVRATGAREGAARGPQRSGRGTQTRTELVGEAELLCADAQGVQEHVAAVVHDLDPPAALIAHARARQLGRRSPGVARRVPAERVPAAARSRSPRRASGRPQAACGRPLPPPPPPCRPPSPPSSRPRPRPRRVPAARWSLRPLRMTSTVLCGAAAACAVRPRAPAAAGRRPPEGCRRGRQRQQAARKSVGRRGPRACCERRRPTGWLVSDRQRPPAVGVRGHASVRMPSPAVGGASP